MKAEKAEKVYLREQGVVEVASIPVKTLRNDRYLKKGPAFASRKLQDELRLQEIAWLASRQLILVPTAVYGYSFPLKANMEVYRDEIADHGVSFETGSKKDLVQVRIRPDVPAKTAVAILSQIIAAVSQRGGDWLENLSDATVRVEEQLKMGIK